MTALEPSSYGSGKNIDLISLCDTVRKKYFIDQEKVLKFEAEGREFAKFLRSLEQFFLTVAQNNFGNKIPFQAT